MKTNPVWNKFIMCLFVLFLLSAYSNASAQITATHFNAEWNSANGVNWFMGLKECKSKGVVDIAKEPEMATKHKIAVIPTIIIFKDGEEVLRFQADLSFKMVATKEEVQEEIDNIIMSDF